MKKAGTILLISAFLLTFMITKSINVMQDTKITGIPAIELLPHPETGVLVPEEWEKIPWLNNNYAVSNYGRLLSIRRNKTIGYKHKKYGYIHADPFVDEKKRVVKIHRVVGEFFIPNPQNKPCINHIDSNRSNNFVFNLEWATYSENTLHGYTFGNMCQLGTKNSKCILTEDQVLEIRRIKSLPNPPTNVSLAIEYGVSNSAIDFIVKRYSWKHI